ncbi:4Fe-4S dicluster domain-containing protein [candidate division GN15 bacterium]|nr:4Fe-4S dicluster domain-containing protein [candidate division GN15 bacterium]
MVVAKDDANNGPKANNSDPTGNGRDYWRSLDQLSQTPEFKEFLHREFPRGTTELAGNNNWTRRSFLTTMGASMALAGLAGCRRPVEKIVPYVTRPEEIEPGVPNMYATAMPVGTGAVGLLVTSREGRPIKVEGNPAHPSSKGGVNPWVQASILNLYDPDRSKEILKDEDEKSVEDFESFWTTEVNDYYSKDGGQELAVICQPSSSPTMARLKEAFQRKYPNASWATWEPLHDENITNGIRIATGDTLGPVYDFSRADIVVSLDADFLGTESDNIANAHGFAEARRVMSQDDSMNRLYAAEAALSITGAMADHRLRVATGRVVAVAAALAAELKRQGLDLPSVGNWADGMKGDDIDAKWLRAAAQDLIAARGKSLVIAGRRQPPELHSLVVAVNQALGNIGKTVVYHELPDHILPDYEETNKVLSRLLWSKIRTVIVLGGNPAYDLPVELEGRAAFLKCAFVVQLSDYVDESSVKGTWHLPRAHYLEAWGDVRAADGTLSVVQPMIQPLHGGRSDIELLNYLTTGEWRSGYDLVRETWQFLLPSGDFEKQWRRVLHDGLLADSAMSPKRVRLNSSALAGELERKLPRAASSVPGDSALEATFLPSATWDGRYANNGWLQEMPDAMTKLAWDNPALFSPAAARTLGIESGDMLELAVGNLTLEIAAWISPGQADNTIGLGLGYGRTKIGKIGKGVGFNTYKLRTVKHLHFVGDVKVTKLNRKHTLATTQDHGSMEGRPIVRENTLAGYKKDAAFYPEGPKHPPLKSLWKEHSYTEGYQWGMSIDLNTCIGCNACVVACQSENNVPIVGKEQVHHGREMHWIRLDRYYAGDPDNPEVVVQPMNCQHCETAPCESVCPVNATVHDDEGLNVMVYNRCIGTRYCSNNCPFKVRRFNFFNYTNNFAEEHKMVQNPEVTVRFRGVMEKCTYCLHRINKAKYQAKVDGRELGGDEVMTACQQACPTKAIKFGNINDSKSTVAKLKKNDRNYQVLEEYNLRPRTSYLAKLRNPHPDLAKPMVAKAGSHEDNGHGGSGHNGNSGDHH